MPAADFEIDADLVSTLLAEQFPQYSTLAITELANGWDNVMFRLGDALTVRMPRRRAAVPLIDNEQRCLPLLAPRLPIAVPAPLHHGAATDVFPMPWSICPWLPGRLATDVTFVDPTAEAVRLGEFLVALHQPAPDDVPENQWRGQDIGTARERVMNNLDRVDLGALAQRDDVERRWNEFSSAPVYAGVPMWLHGDLHAANMLVHDGAISAVIDFGDITGGDPAVDLAIAWMLFDADARAVFRSAATHVDDSMWQRGRAWALHFALVYLANSADNARLRRLGERLLSTVV